MAQPTFSCAQKASLVQTSKEKERLELLPLQLFRVLGNWYTKVCLLPRKNKDWDPDTFRWALRSKSLCLHRCSTWNTAGLILFAIGQSPVFCPFPLSCLNRVLLCSSTFVLSSLLSTTVGCHICRHVAFSMVTITQFRVTFAIAWSRDS